jgi:GH15 family glucan-1,4-alpha-glucosidase
MPSIESYGLIGDCETGALVGCNGSIDWLCWPRFDSDSCFAALLGSPKHGRWQIAPPDPDAFRGRDYRANTLILETRFGTKDGEATLIDFMPPRGTNSDVVRLVRGDHGRVSMRTELVVRFGYGKVTPWIRRIDDEGSGTTLQAVAGPDMVVLRTPIPLDVDQAVIKAEFEVGEGETIPFVLTYGPSYAAPPRPIDPFSSLKDTEGFWRQWCDQRRRARKLAKGREDGLAAAIDRSLITLKALTYAPTGGLVAAVTTSLPERFGGERNWDYRYCWLRDATLTLLALMNAGYYEEAEAWRNWLLRAVAGSPDQLQIMYGIAGERRLTEWEIPWLPGYEGSRPVRVGNAAHGQLQLDVFGEVMDALHQARRGGLPENAAAWSLQLALLSHLEDVWREPDEGIWEMRSGGRHFTYSKVMAWVAFDRGIRSAQEFGHKAPVEKWQQLRQTIHDDICTHGYNSKLRSFVQSYGSTALDASLLLLPSLGFLPASDPRITGTVSAIEHNLMHDGFVRRYDVDQTQDGLSGEEGAFLACTFWLVDAYLMQGRIDDAQKLFDKVLSARNDLGLLSEEFFPDSGRQAGNTPQAFSHVGLVNTAYNLAHALKSSREEQAPASLERGGPESAGQQAESG